MKKFTFTLLTAVSLTVSSVAFAGNGDHKVIKKKQHEALNLFETHHYTEALNLYMEIEPQVKDKGMVDYMIGMCLLSSPEKDKALSYLKAAEETHRPSFVIHYYLGRAYFDAEQYHKAYQYLSLYNEELTHAYGFVFKPYDTSNIPQENLIHYQKSSAEVTKLINICRSHLTKIE